MFVRWQSRKRRRSAFDWGPDKHWAAILVESTRIDGKTKQRHLAYLIGFTESRAKIMFQRCYIWNELAERLNRLANQITPDDRKRIEAAIAKKAPRPSPADFEETERRRKALLAA